MISSQSSVLSHQSSVLDRQFVGGWRHPKMKTVNCELKTLLMPEEIPQDKDHIRRAFRQTPHIVRIPGLSKRYIEPQAVSILYQSSLQIPPDSIQHLELEASRAILCSAT